MSQKAFIQLMRDYAAIARARNRSYADSVHALVAERQATIAAAGLPQPEMKQQLEDVERIALREYGRFDNSFTFGSGG